MSARPGIDPRTKQNAQKQGRRHSWMMMACCIPMLVIGGVLVATGVLRPRFLIFAVGCTAMMALMMRGMDHGGMDHGDNDQGGHDHAKHTDHADQDR